MRLPKYRKHSSRDIGFVEWQGDRRYLPGRHNSEESTDAYRAFLRNVVFAKQPDELPNEAAKISSQKNISVCDVIEQFLDYCQGYYPAGSRSEYHNCRRACRLLKEKFSHLPASEFTPKKLKSLRDAMIARGDARTYINWQVNRIKRCFTWAASEDLIPGSVSQSLTTVQGLRAGRTDAREPIKRMPVPWEHVKKVLPHLSPTVRAMVKMHWLTGARSKSVCRSRPEQFKKSSKVWEW